MKRTHLFLVVLAAASAACAEKSAPATGAADKAATPAAQAPATPAARPESAPSGAATVAASSPAAAPAAKRLFVTVRASGVGWSAADRARAALESLSGISDLQMSGTVGRFTLPAGSKVDEKAIRAAVEGRELTFDGLDAVERAPAAAVWKFDVANAPTWGTKLAEVRSNLLAVPGVADAILDAERVHIEVSDAAAFDEKAATGVLTGVGYEIRAVAKP